MIENVLASRYSCWEINKLFDRTNRYLMEREFWILVLKMQIRNGLKVPEDAVIDYERVKSKINLDSIDKREYVLKHDVKARIEEFNHQAGHQYIHIGLTSRDMTENIELIQIKTALTHIHKKSLFVLKLLGEKVSATMNVQNVARTHNVPAQLSTIGKRYSVIANELILSIKKLEYEISNLPFRGLKGAVGTASDLSIFFTENQIDLMDSELANHYGFSRLMTSVGQVYPRSIDFGFISTLIQLISPLENFALNFRLMAGLNFVSEGFNDSQVGSTAMPHKKNARTAERVDGLAVVLKGLSSMATSISGQQWNEGDVSCSVVRRVIIPDSFFVVDGILNSIIVLLKEMQINIKEIQNEVELELPQLLSSKIMMESVKNGVGRETAHTIVKNLIQNSEGNLNNFKNSVIGDKTLLINEEKWNEILESRNDLLGVCNSQCKKIINKINELVSKSDFDFEITKVK